MEIKSLEGIEIYVLPDNAYCNASDGCKSPLELNECPIGSEICCPEVCANYGESVFTNYFEE